LTRVDAVIGDARGVSLPPPALGVTGGALSLVVVARAPGRGGAAMVSSSLDTGGRDAGRGGSCAVAGNEVVLLCRFFAGDGRGAAGRGGSGAVWRGGILFHLLPPLLSDSSAESPQLPRMRLPRDIEEDEPPPLPGLSGGAELHLDDDAPAIAAAAAAAEAS